MKTSINPLKLSLLAALFFISLSVLANTNPASNTVTSETEKTIKSYFKFPQVLLPNYEAKVVKSNKVEVLFTTDKSGKVNFVMAKTSDPELKLEIEKQFSHLKLNQVKQDVVHSVTLNFRTL